MPTKTLTQRIFEMNIIRTGQEVKQLINSGYVMVSECVVSNEDYLVSDTEEIVILPRTIHISKSKS